MKHNKLWLCQRPVKVIVFNPTLHHTLAAWSILSYSMENSDCSYCNGDADNKAKYKIQFSRVEITGNTGALTDIKTFDT